MGSALLTQLLSYVACPTPPWAAAYETKTGGGGSRTRSHVKMLSQYLSSLMENSCVRDFLVEVDQALYRMQQSLDDSPSIESVLYQAELL